MIFNSAPNHTIAVDHLVAPASDYCASCCWSSSATGRARLLRN